MVYRREDPLWDGRDRLIFSKGHGCYGLYAILADIGFLPREEWENFYTENSNLPGCIERKPEYGLEASCGSLGHGLPMAVGLALGALIQKKRYSVFCIVGDGELQEGSNWEAIQFSIKHQIKNLIIIIDRNRLQAMDFIINILDRRKGDLIKRLKGFGLSPIVCPGHNILRLVKSIHLAKSSKTKHPKVIIAETVKGYGLRCMENIPKFHYRIPTEAELSMGKTYE
jgi:transketolase